MIEFEQFEQLTPSEIQTVETMPSLDEVANDSKRVGGYGIKYLDDRLDGIHKGDMVLLGAATGCGKSTIADIIARHNANLGLKVLHISLENQRGKNFLRQVFYNYRQLVNDYESIKTQREFADKVATHKLDKDILDMACKNAKDYYKGIYMIYKTNADYSVNQLARDIKECFIQDADLIIVDHIDYLDKDCGENDIDHITKTMTMVWNLELRYKIPIICLSHLRKNQSAKTRPIVPSLDDFMGTSNKTKNAPIVIVLAPDLEKEAYRNKSLKYNERPTFCCIRKNRDDGVNYKTGWVKFDTKTGTYKKDFLELDTDYSGTKVENSYADENLENDSDEWYK